MFKKKNYLILARGFFNVLHNGISTTTYNPEITKGLKNKPNTYQTNNGISTTTYNPEITKGLKNKPNTYQTKSLTRLKNKNNNLIIKKRSINKIVGLVGIGLLLNLDFSTVVHCMETLPSIAAAPIATPIAAPIVPLNMTAID